MYIINSRVTGNEVFFNNSQNLPLTHVECYTSLTKGWFNLINQKNHTEPIKCGKSVVAHLQCISNSNKKK